MNVINFMDAPLTCRQAALQHEFAQAMHGCSATLQGQAADSPVMSAFLPEMLRLHALMDGASQDVNRLIHERLNVYSQRHQPFHDATASQLVRECLALRRIFVPFVTGQHSPGSASSRGHEIIDACLSYVVDSFVHEEEILLQSRTQFAEAINTIPQLVWRTTVDGEATFANRPFLDCVGCKLEEVLGWGWLEYIHPDDRSKVMAEWTRVSRFANFCQCGVSGARCWKLPLVLVDRQSLP